MRIDTLSPAEGATRPAKRLGRGIGSGLGKTHLSLAIANVNKLPLIFLSYYRLTMGQPEYLTARLYSINRYNDSLPHCK